ncbi:DUF3152 domain-containing protein [Bifidobacterium sp. ESL0682]|uniref:DUF3152 domain-containing protein n=1 Tax=Bifidobacterium sp. ESL0682 TaxID=2983212 RepID=UPI0023F8B0E5|nr:DUF3152 domain-containing protein [Bifidobacterium sp. ESL0682]WEV42145.1 DUF3152 domain-containing protein [Bifidobacterium sp. ESL0682]
MKRDGQSDEHSQGELRAQGRAMLRTVAKYGKQCLRSLGRGCMVVVRALKHGIRRLGAVIADFLGFAGAARSDKNKQSSARRPFRTPPSQHGSTDVKLTGDDAAFFEISDGFISSVLSDEAEDSATADSSRRGHASSSARVPKSVYWIRRIVVLVVTLAVVAAVVFGVKTAISHTAASHQEHQTTSNVSDKKSLRKHHSKTGGKRQSSKTDLTKATPQPALTDRNRASLLAKAQATVAASGKPAHQYSYCVSTKGDVGGAEVQQEFENSIFRTLNDPRGWPRAGASFTYSADSSHCDFVVYLSQPSLMKTFSGNCSDEYSCRVGNNVIINEDRWNNAMPQMFSAGMSLDRYRTMVINHEVGHRLGHLDNEPSCPAPNAPAPLMQEQSISLRGCTPNEWPTDSELWIR